MARVPLGGCVAAYTMPVEIGGQPFDLMMDTGSATLTVAAATCASCAQAGYSPLYSPGSGAVDEHEATSETDASGDTWSGEVFSDVVAAGAGGPAVATRARTRILSTQSIQGSAVSPFISCGDFQAPDQGVIGFAPADDVAPGTQNYFAELAAEGTFADVFATQLCDRGGELWLGGVDERALAGPVEYTPMTGETSIDYTVGMTDIRVGGATIPIPTAGFGDTLVDTGTSVFVLPPDAFAAATAAIAASPGFQRLFAQPASWFDDPNNCVPTTLSKAEIDAALPPVTLVFGGLRVEAVATESYLNSWNGPGSFCPAIYSLQPGPGLPFAAILGAPVLRSSVVVFDRARKRIGFARHRGCAELGREM